MGAIPLPEGSNVAQTIRRLRAIDAEIFGTLYANAGVIGGDVTILGSAVVTDLTSTSWDGASPLDLTTYDAVATDGYALDDSAGNMQLMGSLFLTGSNSEIVAGIPSISQAHLGGGGLFWQFNWTTPLEAPSGWEAAIGTIQDGDIGGSYPADTNETLEINSANWTGNDSPRLLMNADNWTVSDPYFQFAFGYGGSKIPLHLTETQAKLGWGTVGAPAITFISDDDTGMYRYGSDHLGFSAGGTVRFRFDTSNAKFNVNVLPQTDLGFDLGSTSNRWHNVFAQKVVSGTSAGPLTMSGGAAHQSGANIELYGSSGGNANDAYYDAEVHTFRDYDASPNFATITSAGIRSTAVGSAGAPAFSFTGDTGVGIYRKQTNYLGFATSGAEQGFIDLNGNWNFASNILYGVATIRNTDGSASAPAYSFTSDLDTGMYRPTTNQLAFTTGNSQSLLLGTVGLNSPREITFQNVWSTTHSASAVHVNSSGRLKRQSSARKYKRDIKNADYLKSIKLQPVSYTERDSGAKLYSFIADDMAKQDHKLGIYDHQTGDVEDMHDRGVLAIMAAKINDLEARVKELENA